MNAATDTERPWYNALEGGALSPRNLLRTAVGRRITIAALWVLEGVGAVPKGTGAVQRLLHEGANGFVGAGRLGIFTPSYYTKARKPETPQISGPR